MASLECPICLQQLTNPVVLTCCGSSACHSCLLKLPTPRKCPFDRNLIKPEDPTNWLRNRALQSHIESLATTVAAAASSSSFHHNSDLKSMSPERRLDCIRRIASEAGWKEIYGSSKVISFSLEGARVNVYYTNMTVGSCLDHPQLGKTQLFRKDIDLSMLYEVFNNPRMHTNKACYDPHKKRKMASSYESSSRIANFYVPGDYVYPEGIDATDDYVYPKGIDCIPSYLRHSDEPYILRVMGTTQGVLKVREGVELESNLVYKMDGGAYILASEKGYTFDNLPRYLLSNGDGWISEFNRTVGPNMTYTRCCELLKTTPETEEKEFIIRHLEYLEEEVTYTTSNLIKMVEKDMEEAERRRLAREEEERKKKEELERQAKEERRRQERLAKEEAERKRQKKVQKRGVHLYWELYHSKHIPDNLENIQSVAIGDGGYIAIHDDLSSMYHGIPDNVANQIERHHNDNLELIAIGHRKRYGEYPYYLLKSNGKQFGNLSSSCWDAICDTEARPVLVVLGVGADSFFIKFDRGRFCYRGLNDSCAAILERGVSVTCIWIGRDDSYFLNYTEDGEKKRSYYHLPSGLGKYANDKRLDVKTMCYDYDSETYLVSYNRV